MKPYIALFIVLLLMTSCVVQCAKGAGLYDPDASTRAYMLKEDQDKFCSGSTYC